MRWDRGSHSPNIEDRRSEGGGGLGFGGGGGGFPLWGLLSVAGRFGWKGIVVALVVIAAITYGGDLCSGFGGRPAPPHGAVGPRGDTVPQDDELTQFVSFVLDDVQDTWRKELTGYRDAKLVLFRDGIRSACGSASSAVGPFYCPLDRKVYIDLSFYEQLRRRFGAPGDFAQAYVIAHELGHHVQNLRGVLGHDDNSSVRVELQADCLAGAWARSANTRGLLETGDVDEALNAAAQIGDDTIQRRSGGRIQPETFTHGSAAQRTDAFHRGYQGGHTACGVR